MYPRLGAFPRQESAVAVSYRLGFVFDVFSLGFEMRESFSDCYDCGKRMCLMGEWFLLLRDGLAVRFLLVWFFFFVGYGAGGVNGENEFGVGCDVSIGLGGKLLMGSVEKVWYFVYHNMCGKLGMLYRSSPEIS